jgi:FkbM family methyltransferase
MDTTLTLSLADGARVVVPNSLDLITPYVPLEQRDWFEDEIVFVRQVLEPGQRVIDIGTNVGVYTLSMALRVGPEGRCWAFEPASRTAALLQAGIRDNGFAHVHLEHSASSSEVGQATFSVRTHSELNALVMDGKPLDADENGTEATAETVPVATLDDCLQRHAWADMHFLKIDAEGQ